LWRHKVYADIRGGYLGRGRQTTVGLSTTAIFSIFPAGCLLLYIYYAVPRQLFTDSHVHDLE